MRYCDEDKPLSFKIERVHSYYGVITIIFLNILKDDGQEQTYVIGTLMPLVLNESEIDTEELFYDFGLILRNYEKRFYARNQDVMSDISQKYFGLSDEFEVFGIFDTQSWEQSPNNLYIKESRFLKEKLKIIEVSRQVAKFMSIEYHI